MQFVETKKLKPGMRLAKPIYNKMGVMLYERNSRLTQTGINSIENFGLIGIFILEPAEPLPPLTEEEIAFEQFQTIYMFQAKNIFDKLSLSKNPDGLDELSNSIIKHYGNVDHKIHFTQNLRSSFDFVYKHTISTAILVAFIGNTMRMSEKEKSDLVKIALLFDIGYLFVPKMILEKGDDLLANDKIMIENSRKKGLALLQIESNRYHLSKHILNILEQYAYIMDDTNEGKWDDSQIHEHTKILKVADSFDRLTAMNLHHSPVSELTAIRQMLLDPKNYTQGIVNALAKSIHILPRAASVDLSNGDKGIVIMDHPENFMMPLILNINDNRLYDLSDPDVRKTMKIVDTMKTMDNRILIDEHSLALFSVDDNIRFTIDKYKKKKKEKEERKELYSSIF